MYRILKLWCDDPSELLKLAGFTENAKEKCVHNVERSGSNSVHTIHVDELLK